MCTLQVKYKDFYFLCTLLVTLHIYKQWVILYLSWLFLLLAIYVIIHITEIHVYSLYNRHTSCWSQIFPKHLLVSCVLSQTWLYRTYILREVLNQKHFLISVLHKFVHWPIRSSFFKFLIFVDLNEFQHQNSFVM